MQSNRAHCLSHLAESSTSVATSPSVSPPQSLWQLVWAAGVFLYQLLVWVASTAASSGFPSQAWIHIPAYGYIAYTIFYKVSDIPQLEHSPAPSLSPGEAPRDLLS